MPVASAVIRMGAIRSPAPATTCARRAARRARRRRCSKWAISTMPLRIVSPKTVTNPTMAPSDRWPAAPSTTAAMPPTKRERHVDQGERRRGAASGSRSAGARRCRSAASAPSPSSRWRAARAAAYSPPTSAYDSRRQRPSSPRSARRRRRPLRARGRWTSSRSRAVRTPSSCVTSPRTSPATTSRDGAERDDLAARATSGRRSEALRVARDVVGERHGEVGLLLVADHAADRESAEPRPQGLLDRRRRHAGAEERVAPRLDAHAGGREQRLRRTSTAPGTAASRSRERAGGVLERRQVGAVHAHHDGAAAPLEQLVDALVQVLLDVEGEAGDRRASARAASGDLARGRPSSSSRTSSSLRSAPQVSSDRVERPMSCVTERTPGMASSAGPSARPTRVDSSSPVPGAPGHVHDEVGLVELGQELEPQERDQRRARRGAVDDHRGQHRAAAVRAADRAARS